MAQEHRRVPVPFKHKPFGWCRICGLPIRKPDGSINRRKGWHGECADKYNAISDPRIFRPAIYQRDEGHCRACKLWVPFSECDIDHIQPLVDGGSFDYDNLQTLCRPCHKLKTAKEANVRAIQKATGDGNQGEPSL